MKSDLPPLHSLANGRYRLEGVVGEGGFAAVYQATDTTLKVKRAIKVLSPRAARRQVVRDRLNAEARAMARISHPNVLRIYDIVAEGVGQDTLYYVVMDFAPGGTLMDWGRAHGRMPPDLAMRYMVQVLSALAAAHAAGIVHRDVKPQNILLDERGVALLADFGIALLAEDGDMRMTRTGVAMGSFAYMAPEQRIDARSVGPEADLYAVGSTLYFLITSANPVDLFTAGEGSERWVGIPPELVQILRRSNAHKPEDRYPSARSFAAALLAALDHVGSQPLVSLAPWDPSSFPDPSEHFNPDSRSRNLDSQSLISPSAEAVRQSVAQATHEATGLMALPGGPGGTAPAWSPEEVRALGPLQRRLVGAAATFDAGMGLDTPALVPPAPSTGTVIPESTYEPTSRRRTAGLGLGVLAMVVLVALVLWRLALLLSPSIPAGVGADAAEESEPITEQPPEQPPEQIPGEEAEEVAPEVVEEGSGDAAPAVAEAVVEQPRAEQTQPSQPQVVDAAPTPAPALGALSGDWTGSFSGTLYVIASFSGPDEAITGSITTVVAGKEEAFPVVGRYQPDLRLLVLEDTLRHPTAGRYELKLSEDGRQLSGTHIQNATGRRAGLALER